MRAVTCAALVLLAGSGAAAQERPEKKPTARDKAAPAPPKTQEEKDAEAAGKVVAGGFIASVMALGVIAIVAIVAFVLSFGLLPTWIAVFRKHPNLGPIFIVNFFLGGILVGWVVALAWSLSAIERPRSSRRSSPAGNPFGD